MHDTHIALRTHRSFMQQRRNTAIEWTLGLAVPIIFAGPGCESYCEHIRHTAHPVVDYIVQGVIFQVIEGVGCADALDDSVLSILLIWSWNITPPLILVTVYYHASRIPTMTLVLISVLTQLEWPSSPIASRPINHFLNNNDSIS